MGERFREARVEVVNVVSKSRSLAVIVDEAIITAGDFLFEKVCVYRVSGTRDVNLRQESVYHFSLIIPALLMFCNFILIPICWFPDGITILVVSGSLAWRRESRRGFFAIGGGRFVHMYWMWMWIRMYMFRLSGKSPE